MIFLMKLFTSVLQKNYLPIFQAKKKYFISSRAFKIFPAGKKKLAIFSLVDRFFSNNFQDCNNLCPVKCFFKNT